MKNLVVLSAACGVGKSTIKDELNGRNILGNYVCIDTDEVGINWWDYAGTENENKFSDDCLAEAVRMSNDENLIFVTCMNPYDFYGKVSIPKEITSTFFIGMTCSDEEITKRLKARPEERMCGSDEFIAGQIQYNNWFKDNSGKFQFYIDNTDKTVAETAAEIAEFIKGIRR
ncbi:MAG: AAA family ATPase [Oscillospiraceae bacterium]|nr:AAA family ATPase [Oscillospiraceae bacterium]